MSEIIGTMLKENPVAAFAGKQASVLDLGWPLFKNEEITNFCRDLNPITELASKECLGGYDESILENLEEEIDYGYYSPKFELSNEVQSWAK